MVVVGFALGPGNAAIFGGANFKGRCQGAFSRGMQWLSRMALPIYYLMSAGTTL